MRLAISNLAWPAGADAAAAPLLRAHNVEGVELALTKIWPEPLDAPVAEVRAYRRQWETQGLRIAALQAILFGKAQLTLFDDEPTRRRTGDYLAGIIERAALLGAGVLVFGSPKNRQRQKLPRAEARAVAIPFFRELGRIARRHSVRLCIEPNPPVYGCDFVTSVAEAVELVDAVGDDGFALHLDAAGMSLVGDPAAESIREAGRRCRHFHISQPFLAEVCGGTVPHHEFAQALRTANYRGWLSIEMGESKQPAAWTAAVERALAFVRSTYFSSANATKNDAVVGQGVAGDYNVHPIRRND